MPPFRTPVMTSVVTVFLNAAPSYIHTQNIRKYHDGLGRRLETRVSDISLEGRLIKRKFFASLSCYGCVASCP